MSRIAWYLGLAVSLLMTVAPAAYAQPPIGFERWTPAPSSGVVFGYEFNELFSDFSNSASTIHGTLFAPGLPPTKPRRMIDIEIRKVAETDHNVVDGVWVENTGAFKLDSWLINRMNKQQLMRWTRSRGYVMLDIERYTRNGKTYWAGILQRNPHQVEWDIMLGSTIGEITLIAAVTQMRVVDVDYVGFRVGRCPPPPGACAIESLYDAVLVKNTGNNQMAWHLEEGWNFDPHVTSDSQLIDREKDDVKSFGGTWWSAYLSVVVNNVYETHEFLSQQDVSFLHNHQFKRVIDLEIDPQVEWWEVLRSYYTVNRLD